MFFSAAHRTFSTINYIGQHKTGLNKGRKIEITSFILSAHYAINLEINSYRNPETTQIHESRTMQYWIKEGRNPKGDLKIPRIEQNRKHNITKYVGHKEGQPAEESLQDELPASKTYRDLKLII